MKKKYAVSLMVLVVLFLIAAAFLTTAHSLQKNNRESKESNGHQLSGHGAVHEHSEGEEKHRHEAVIELSQEQINDLGIETEKAGRGEIILTISTRGKIVVHPDRLVHVLPKISGVAKEAKKNIGDDVEEGEVLATLESREMADIKGGYLAAKEKLALTSALLERERRLNEKKISAEQDFLNAQFAHEEARINLQLAKQKLHAFGVDEKEIASLSSRRDPELRLYDIRAPMHGTIIARHIIKGEFIENSTTIYEIADLRAIWVDIGIYPKDLVKVRKGQYVDIFFADGTKTSAQIIYLSPIIQDETITAKAIAEIENPSVNWRPGSFVKVDISTENMQVPILIPKEAIQEIDGKAFVFVKIPGGFEKRQVELGLGNDVSVEVTSGLSQGEEYASLNTFYLKADLQKGEAEHEHR